MVVQSQLKIAAEPEYSLSANSTTSFPLASMSSDLERYISDNSLRVSMNLT